MAVFLVLVPKAESVSYRDDSSVNRVLQVIQKEYRRIVGDTYGTEPSITKPGTGNPAYVLLWKRAEDRNTVVSKNNSWAVSSGTPVSSEVVEHVHIRADRYVYDEPVWGSYAAVLGQRYTSRLLAWNTSPALEAIHYGESEDFIVISNRPLMAALALAQGMGSEIKLSENYLDQYLLYGFNITDQSAFEGVKVLDATKALALNRESLSLMPLPSGSDTSLSHVHSFEDGIEALSDALQNAMHRAVESVPSGPIQLRMSGGKDSRLLLGLINSQDVDSYAVTFGKAADSETKISYFLCQKAGVDLRFKSPQPVSGDSLSERIGRTIALSDGLPASEPHTSIYEGASPGEPGEGIMLGQWPLFKGGMAKKLKYGPGGIDKALLNQANWMVSEETRKPYDQFLTDWKNSRMVYNDLEFLYLFAREFRSGRWLQAHINLYERDASIAYPIADSEVTTVSDTLSMFEKISQRTIFGALEKIWPTAVKVPLSNGGAWRFEVGGPDEALGADTYEQRHSEIDIEVPQDSGPESQPRAYEYTAQAGRDLAQLLVQSPRWDLLKSKIKDSVVAAIEQTATEEFTIPEGSSQREFLKILWRLYVADVWLSKTWLEVD